MAAAEELFDLCDEWGQSLGRTKARGSVHRDGDWHRSFHCWVLARTDHAEAEVILQRRALDKDTWPGLWDVSVAGHYSAGEGIDGGLRELREEMGLEVTVDELLPVGRRREVARHDDGVLDREVQDVYFLRRPIDLRDLRPNDEVIGVVSLPAAALAQMRAAALGHTTVCRGGRAERGRLREAHINLAAAHLVPGRDDYYSRVAETATRLARGEPIERRSDWW